MHKEWMFLAALVVGCGSSTSASDAPPVKRVTTTAAQAWPNRPEEPAPLSALEAAQGTAIWIACIAPDSIDATSDGASLFGASWETFDAFEERAIPSSGTGAARWKWWARAAIAAHGDCATVKTLATQMPSGATCEEDGCWVPTPTSPTPTCSGDVARFGTSASAIVRDCSQSFTHCDASSATGCTDRAPLACDASLAHRCDGDIKLGCDHTGKTSFHDCTLVGAKCVETPTGAECKRPAADACDAMKDSKCTDGTTLHACVRGVFVDVDCAGLGLTSCTNAHCVK